MFTSSTELDRLALRLGALRSARRRKSLRDGAWAAERLRLDGIVLDRSDARFAHDAVVRFGHALRVARLRRPLLARTFDLSAAIPARATNARRRLSALLVVGALLLFVLLIAPPAALQGDAPAAARAPAAGAPAPTALPLRGRSDGIIVQVPIARPAPPVSPTLAPPSSEPIDIEDVLARRGITSAGGGSGTGSGTGTGVGTGTGSGTAPAPTAAPTPVPENVMHLRGRVVDSRSGVGVPGVCVVIGATSCDRAPITNEAGDWAVDLNIGQVLSWNIKFVKTDWLEQSINVPSKPGIVYADTVQLRSFR